MNAVCDQYEDFRTVVNLSSTVLYYKPEQCRPIDPPTNSAESTISSRPTSEGGEGVDDICGSQCVGSSDSMSF